MTRDKHRHEFMTKRERLVIHNRLTLARAAIKTARATMNGDDIDFAYDAIFAVLPTIYLGQPDVMGPSRCSNGLLPMLDKIVDQLDAIPQHAIARVA